MVKKYETREWLKFLKHPQKGDTVKVFDSEGMYGIVKGIIIIEGREVAILSVCEPVKNPDWYLDNRKVEFEYKKK